MSKIDSKVGSVNLNGKGSCPPNPTIRGGGNSQGCVVEYDTLELSLQLDSKKSDIFGKLYEVKKRLQATDCETSESITLSVAGSSIDWNVHRTGANRLYPYMLTHGDITLILSERGPGSTIPGGLLKIGSMSCQNGASQALEDVKAWLRAFRIDVISDKVSRVDFCFDVFDICISDAVHHLTDSDYMITKARSHDVHYSNRKASGVTIGRGAILLRMYDKIRELNKPERAHKKQFFAQKWGQYPEKCTRVEFQLRREALKELVKQGSFFDVNHHKNEIWNYLTKIWFRHTSKRVDRENNHQKRFKSSHFWKKVQSANTERKISYRQIKVAELKSLKQIKSIIKGGLTTCLAGFGQDPKDYFGIMATAQKLITDILDDEMIKNTYVWIKKFNKRQTETRLDYDHLSAAPFQAYGVNLPTPRMLF